MEGLEKIVFFSRIKELSCSCSFKICSFCMERTWRRSTLSPEVLLAT